MVAAVRAAAPPPSIRTESLRRGGCYRQRVTGGDSSLRALEREHGELPATWRVLTGGDGEHVLLAAPNGVIIGNVTAETTDNPPLGPGIDVRARGGYIVAPPSQHISGKVYAWSAGHHPKGVALAPAPDWLIERLTARPAAPKAFDNEKSIEPTPSDVWSKLTQQPVTEYHDAVATKIAGHLFRQGVDYQLIVGMMHAWNSSWCSPPLGHRELTRIVERIADKEAARIERELGP